MGGDTIGGGGGGVWGSGDRAHIYIYIYGFVQKWGMTSIWQFG